MAVAAIVSSQRAMLSRLRRLFGLTSSERSRDVLGSAKLATPAAAVDHPPTFSRRHAAASERFDADMLIYTLAAIVLIASTLELVFLLQTR